MRIARVTPLVALLAMAWGCTSNAGSNESQADGGGAGDAARPGAPDAAAATTRTLTLQTLDGALFVGAEGGGGGDVHADRPEASPRETFLLADLNGGELDSGDRVTFATADGHFLSAVNGGGGLVDAHATTASDSESFRMIRIAGDGAIVDGDQVALQAVSSGLYVSAEIGGGDVVANRTAVQGWETFVIGPAGTAPTWTLTWSDEFAGATGAAIDGTKWGFDQGGGGWGNGELENYTNRTDNVRLDGAGHLEIVTRAEAFGGDSYTSGRVNSAGRFTQSYGRFEARVRMPAGKGIWPAFWTLGDNIGGVGWPQCGELDIMEAAVDFGVNHGSAHGPGYSGGNPLTGIYRLPSGSLADDYHLYAMDWSPGQVRWYVDGTMYEQRTPADVPPGTTWVYDHPFFLIMNVAVGGAFPGPPDGSTVFPQTMSVDYVRVFSR